MKCHDCVTGTKRRFNRNLALYRFCQYKEIQYTIIISISICVCVHIEGEKEVRETADENHSHKHLSDGISESTNKRQEKTLKVMCFIEKKSLQAHLLDRLPLPHLRPHLVEID